MKNEQETIVKVAKIINVVYYVCMIFMVGVVTGYFWCCMALR